MSKHNISGNKNFARIKVREYLSWLSVITSDVALLVTVEVFVILVTIEALFILVIATGVSSLALGVVCLLRHRSIARILSWSIILVHSPSWHTRIIVSHIGAPKTPTGKRVVVVLSWVSKPTPI